MRRLIVLSACLVSLVLQDFSEPVSIVLMLLFLGMVGVMLAPVLGRLVDKMVPWYGTLFATFLMLLTAAVSENPLSQTFTHSSDG